MLRERARAHTAITAFELVDRYFDQLHAPDTGDVWDVRSLIVSRVDQGGLWLFNLIPDRLREKLDDPHPGWGQA